MHTLIPASSFPVSLAEAKHQLGFFHSEDDEAVKALIAMATEEAEAYTGLATLFKTVEKKLAEFPVGMLVLSGLPFAKLNSVRYYDENNTLQTLNASAYRVYAHGYSIQIEAVDSWPNTYDRQDAVVIEYVIGYAGTATGANDQDLFQMIGHPFEDNQRVTIYKATDATIPSAFTERRIYYTTNTTADSFQLSATESGTIITLDANTTGQVYVGFAEVPRVIKQAIMMTLASCNEYRTDEITGTIVSKIMMSSRYLLDHAKPKRL